MTAADLEYASMGVNARDLIRSMDAVIEILQRQRHESRITGGKINRSFVELKIPEKLVIIGDIHGDMQSLFNILQGIGFESFLANPDNKMIFLGDYVDRGSNSIGVLYTICCLKKKYPESVILMRGNHEAPVEFPFPSHDLPLEVIRHYGKENGKLVYYKKILRLFRLLSLAILIEGCLFMVHGGLPTEDIIPDFKESIATAQENHISNRIMEEILWNDPREYIQDQKNWEYSTRGIGKHFGINISKLWLGISRTKVIVRGHEPCQGFRIDHDASVITLFSCKEAYPAFQAAYVIASGQQLKLIKDAKGLSGYVIRI